MNGTLYFDLQQVIIVRHYFHIDDFVIHQITANVPESILNKLHLVHFIETLIHSCNNHKDLSSPISIVNTHLKPLYLCIRMYICDLGWTITVVIDTTTFMNLV